MPVPFSSVQVPVIHHDNTLDRCTQARGNLWEYTLSEIEGLDAGSHFSDDFAGEKIPTLSSLIATCRDLSLGVNLEIKHVTVDADAEPTAEEAAMEAELANRACDVIEQLSVQAHEVVLSSFSRVCIQVLRKRAPHLRCGLLVVAIPNDWIPFIDEHSCVSLNFDHTQSTRTQILACRAARPDIPLYCYTVNTGSWQGTMAQDERSWLNMDNVTSCRVKAQIFINGQGGVPHLSGVA